MKRPLEAAQVLWLSVAGLNAAGTLSPTP